MSTHNKERTLNRPRRPLTDKLEEPDVVIERGVEQAELQTHSRLRQPLPVAVEQVEEEGRHADWVDQNLGQTGKKGVQSAKREKGAFNELQRIISNCKWFDSMSQRDVTP